MMTMRYLLLAWFIFDTLAVYLFFRRHVLTRTLTFWLLTWTVNGLLFQICTILNSLGIHVVHESKLHIWNIIIRIHIATIVGVVAIFNWWALKNE